MNKKLTKLQTSAVKNLVAKHSFAAGCKAVTHVDRKKEIKRNPPFDRNCY